MGGRAERAREVRRRGYTLVELVVVVGILIVMTYAGLPFFSAMMQGSRLDAAARLLAGDVREARAKATQTGWQYQIVGYNVGGGSAFKNQYRLVGKASASATDKFPDETVANAFESATKMAGPWINFNQLYPGVSLNQSNSNPSFYVSFNSQGVAFEWNSSFAPLNIVHDSGRSRQVSVTSAGSVKVQ
jgi:Tfp pilus assembly protein FimT